MLYDEYEEHSTLPYCLAACLIWEEAADIRFWTPDPAIGRHVDMARAWGCRRESNPLGESMSLHDSHKAADALIQKSALLL